jgi:PQQ-dependent catabolism-associated beta-propeller protein
MAHFINTETYDLDINVLVDNRPRYARFTADGAKLYVTAEIGGTVNVIDPATGDEIGKIEFAVSGVPPEALQPVGMRITKDDKLAFVALGPSNRVAVIDVATDEVLEYLLVGRRVWHMDFTPDEKYLFTTNGNSNDVSVIDVEDLKVIKSIPVGELPWGVAIMPK